MQSNFAFLALFAFELYLNLPFVRLLYLLLYYFAPLV